MLMATLLTVQTCCAQDPSKEIYTLLDVLEFDDGILVRKHETPVLHYQTKAISKNGTHRRANYVHPLYDLDGNELTEDFPKDHLHHRGIFWAWHQVIVGDQVAGDGWLTKDFDWKVTSTKTEDFEPLKIRISSEVVWQSSKITDKDNRPLPLVNESTRIDMHLKMDDLRMIDFEIRLLAAQPDVRIGGSDNAKGYGGFSARLIQPKDIAFHTANGVVEPKKTQMDCGNWVDIVGTFGKSDAKSGVAIFVHPSSAGFPQKWILRSKVKSMQNPVFPGRQPIALSQTEPTILRYRILLHRGEQTVDQLNAWYKEYSEVDLD